MQSERERRVFVHGRFCTPAAVCARFKDLFIMECVALVTRCFGVDAAAAKFPLSRIFGSWLKHEKERFKI